MMGEMCVVKRLHGYKFVPSCMIGWVEDGFV